MTDEPQHRALGRALGDIRKKLRVRTARRGVLTQAHVAELSDEIYGSRETLLRGAVVDIETGNLKRPVAPDTIMRYLEVLAAVAAGRHGVPPQPDLTLELDQLRRQLGGAPNEGTRDVESGQPEPGLEVPASVFNPLLSPPGALLRSEYGIVPFHGREREIEDLRNWAHRPENTLVRLYTGGGGVGKTRLLLEFIRRLESTRWRVGFLPEGASFLGGLQRLAGTPEQLCVVVDYAEGRREELISLLSVFRARRTSSTRRIILLARAATDWWYELRNESHWLGEMLSGAATERIPLGDLALTIAERRASFSLAVQAIATALHGSVERSRVATPRDLSDAAYCRALILHLRAFAAVVGENIKGESGALDFLLARERRFWRRRARDLRLPAGIERGIGQAMAAVTLARGVTSEAQAIALFEKLRYFKGQPYADLAAIARLLHDIYAGQRWIDPVLPDLLGEHLCEAELGGPGGDAIMKAMFGTGS